ncbi:MAG: glycerophosphoryl diester phosphodiesterase [Polaribacter sp.]|jgi:glycerophosphoryl diester phosphodiesterase
MIGSTSLARYAETAGRGPDAVQILAHKGGAGLMPDNTLEAYRVAVSLGVDLINCDLAMTADGTLVVSHDQWLNPDITRKAAAASWNGSPRHH